MDGKAVPCPLTQWTLYLKVGLGQVWEVRQSVLGVFSSQNTFLSIAISPSHHFSIWITQCRQEEIKQCAYQLEVVSDK